MNKARLYVAAAMLGALAMAPTAQAAADWTGGWATIAEYNLNPPGGVGNEMLFIRLVGATNTSGCTVADGYYMSITSDHHKRLFAMLTTAKAAGQRLRLHFTGTCHPSWSWSQIDGVWLE